MAETNFRVRVFFALTGRLAMLSHLELARALERMVRRATLPYAISQGFSPHMKISFGSALPVGIGGLSECFDLQLTRYIAPETIREAFLAQSMQDLKVLRLDYVDKRSPAASVAFPVSVYCVRFAQALVSIPKVPFSVVVFRKKKKRELIVSEYLLDGPHVQGDTLEFTLLAKPTGSLRADVFVNALFEDRDMPEIVSFMRTEQRSS